MSGCFILFDHIEGKKKLMRVGSREEEEELGKGQNVENQNVENQNVENQNVDNQNVENQNVENHKERQKILNHQYVESLHLSDQNSENWNWSEFRKFTYGVLMPKRHR